MRQFLGLIRSDLDPRNSRDAGEWLATALGPFAENAIIWCGQQDKDEEDASSIAAQFIDAFSEKTLATSTPSSFRPSQLRRLSALIDDEHGQEAGQFLWPFAHTHLVDRPTHSLMIVTNERLCRGLANAYVAATEKPTIESPRGELLFAHIDLSKDWPHSVMRQK